MNCFCLSKKSFSSASFTHAPIIRHSVGMLGGDRGRKVPLSPYVKQMNFRTDSKSFISEEFIRLSYRFHQLGMDRPSSRKVPQEKSALRTLDCNGLLFYAAPHSNLIYQILQSIINTAVYLIMTPQS